MPSQSKRSNYLRKIRKNNILKFSTLSIPDSRQLAVLACFLPILVLIQDESEDYEILDSRMHCFN